MFCHTKRSCGRRKDNICYTHRHTHTKKISLNKVAHLHSRLLPIRIFLNVVPLTAHKRVPDHCS